MSANPDWDELQTTTLQKRLKTVKDNWSKATPLFYKLRDRVRVNSNGGRTIVEPVRLEGGTGLQWYHGYDTLKCEPSPGPTAIENPWVQAASCVTMCGFEECVNSGPHQFINILQERIDAMEQTVIQEMNKTIWTGAKPADYDKAINSIDYLLSDEPYGGIDPSRDEICAQWTPWIDEGLLPAYIEANGPDSAEDFKGTPFSWDDLMQALLCMNGGYGGVDCIFVAKDLYLSLMRSANAQAELLRRQDTAELGFEGIRFMGVDIFMDFDVPKGCVYLLNTNCLTWWTCGSRFAKMRDFVVPHNQDAKLAHVLWMMQLTTNSRRAHGKLTCRIPAC